MDNTVVARPLAVHLPRPRRHLLRPERREQHRPRRLLCLHAGGRASTDGGERATSAGVDLTYRYIPLSQSSVPRPRSGARSSSTTTRTGRSAGSRPRPLRRRRRAWPAVSAGRPLRPGPMVLRSRSPTRRAPPQRPRSSSSAATPSGSTATLEARLSRATTRGFLFDYAQDIDPSSADTMRLLAVPDDVGVGVPARPAPVHVPRAAGEPREPVLPAVDRHPRQPRPRLPRPMKELLMKTPTSCTARRLRPHGDPARRRCTGAGRRRSRSSPRSPTSPT